MKMSIAAQKADVNIKTLDQWLRRDEYQPYWSESAQTSGGEYRQLTDEDVLVANTIRHLRSMGVAHDVIAERLGQGERHEELPFSGVFAEATTEAEQLALMVAMREANQLLEQSNNDLEEEIQTLTEKIKALEDEKLKDREQIGFLRGQLEVYKEMLKSTGGK